MTIAVLTLKTAVKLVALVAIVLSSIPICLPGFHGDAPEPTVPAAQTFHVEPYGGSAASAAKRQLPSPTEIIDRFIEAAGGEDALRKHVSRHSSGEIEVDGVVTPTRLFQDVGVAQIETIFTQIEYDSVDPAVFVLPEAIKALVRGRFLAAAIR